MEEIPILILHGWRVPVENYFPLQDLFLKAGFKVFIPQLPGFGEKENLSKIYIKKGENHPAGGVDEPIQISHSPKASVQSETENHPANGVGIYTLNNYVQFVIDFAEKNKLDKFFLIGHSFGGRVAIKLTASHPEKVKALILTGVPAIRDENLKRIAFLILAKLGKAFLAIPPFYLLKGKARKILYSLAGEQDYSKTKGLMRETFKNIISENLASLLSKIKTPCLLLWGEKDKMVPVTIAQKIYDRIPKTDLIVISNASHKLPYENPKLFSKKCLEFLEGNKK